LFSFTAARGVHVKQTQLFINTFPFYSIIDSGVPETLHLSPILASIGSVSPLSGSSTMDHNHPPTPHSLHTHNDYIEKIKFLEEKIAKLSDDEHRIRQAAHEQITQALTLSNDVRAQSAMKTEQINELQTDLNRKQNQITEQINLILRLKQMVKSLGGDPSSVDPSPKEVKTHAFKF
jgi:hypothetical protein